MAQLSDADIRHLADLSKIKLSDDDVAKFKLQLSSILKYVEQLEAVDTAGLEPTSQVTGLTNVKREDDDTSDTMAKEQLLNQTPQSQDGQIKVPKVL